MSYSTSTRLLSLIIPLVLKLLRSVHALWKNEDRPTLPIELKEAEFKQNSAKVIASLLDTDPAKLKEDDIGQWLHVIRERGYILLGLCAPIQGAFSDLLESSSIAEAIMENLNCMEFRHVSKLIDLVLIPLVKNCPRELLGEWILKLLRPLFRYCCEDIFCDAWFRLLNEGRAGYCYYFGCPRGSEDNVKKFEDYLLLDLTRKVSKLLGVLASLEPNDALMRVDLQPLSTVKTASCDSKCASSNSVVGHSILNDCFEMLKMTLLGSWVDGEATLDAVPFCHALVQVAVATNNRKLRLFIVDDMLPATIKRLCDDLPCAVQQTIKKLSDQLDSSISKRASKDLLVLCEEIYKVYIHSQDFNAEDSDNENLRDPFKDWFARQKQELLVKASCAIPVHFPVKLWNWEFEEEFQRYLPTYIDILYEVDAMDDCPEYDYSDSSTLIKKLRPEFRSKHDINSLMDCHVWMIDKMVHRKLSKEYPKRRSHQLDKWLCKLITSKPYLKNSYESAMARLMENPTIDAKVSHLDVQDAVNMFYHAILSNLEPHFHPLVREGQKDFLIKVAHQFIFADETGYEPLEPESEDFPLHLQCHARSFIYRMKIESKYFEAREHVRLHQEFDNYLSSGELDDDIYCKFSSSETTEEFADNHLARGQFGSWTIISLDCLWRTELRLWICNAT
uniref:Uncharacterized protein n=1 Tax=Avena sativa TaxID=4498 RepID=A0ACD5ZT35_AVESA